MPADILLRAGVTALIILVGYVGFQLINRIILTRAESQNSNLFFPAGKPTLLYFTTPNCAPCKTIQRPVVNIIRENLGERIQVIEIDATAQPQLASVWGVMSVPTTFIIDQTGKPRHVNHGVASSEKLHRQLEEIL